MATTPVPSQDGAPSRYNAQPGVVTAAVAGTVLIGLMNTIGGLGHMQGVIQTAARRGYPYDFRYAGLLIVGIAIAYSGVLLLWAAPGLARGERAAWDRALSGTILMLLVAVPLIPVDGPGQDNAILQALVPGIVSLILLLAALPRLGTYTPAARLHCGRCGRKLSPYWRERCGVCHAPFSEFPPVSDPP